MHPQTHHHDHLHEHQVGGHDLHDHADIHRTETGGCCDQPNHHHAELTVDNGDHPAGCGCSEHVRHEAAASEIDSGGCGSHGNCGHEHHASAHTHVDTGNRRTANAREETDAAGGAGNHMHEHVTGRGCGELARNDAEPLIDVSAVTTADMAMLLTEFRRQAESSKPETTEVKLPSHVPKVAAAPEADHETVPVLKTGHAAPAAVLRTENSAGYKDVNDISLAADQPGLNRELFIHARRSVSRDGDNTVSVDADRIPPPTPHPVEVIDRTEQAWPERAVEAEQWMFENTDTAAKDIIQSEFPDSTPVYTELADESGPVALFSETSNPYTGSDGYEIDTAVSASVDGIGDKLPATLYFDEPEMSQADVELEQITDAESRLEELLATTGETQLLAAVRDSVDVKNIAGIYLPPVEHQMFQAAIEEGDVAVVRSWLEHMLERRQAGAYSEHVSSQTSGIISAGMNQRSAGSVIGSMVIRILAQIRQITMQPAT